MSSEEERPIPGMSTEELDDFERELARMMVENSGDVRKAATSKSSLAEMSLPAIRRQTPAAPDESDDRNLKFTLIMKKGAKQQVREA